MYPKPRKMGVFYSALFLVILYFPLPEGVFHRKPLSSDEQSGLSGAYKLVAGFSFVSQMGSWLQYTALPLAMLTITHNAVQWIGIYWVVIALVSIPGPLLGGVLADRFPVWTLVLVTQTITVAVSWLVWHLVATGSTHLWLLIGLQALGVTAGTIGSPGQVKLVLALVNKEVEERAIAVNSLLRSIAKVIGPAIAGLLLFWIKPAWLFLANSGSYLPLLLVLTVLPWIMASTKFRQMRAESVPDEQPPQEASTEKVRLLGAIRYAWQKQTLRLVLLVSAIMVLFTFNGNIITPLMASQVFHRSGSFGLLVAAQGIGEMLSLSLIVRSGKKIDTSDEKTDTSDERAWLLRPCPNQMLLWAGANCVAIIGFGFSHWLAIGLIMEVLMGFTAGPYLNAASTLIQTTPDDVRGRIVGLQIGLSGACSLAGKFLTSWLIAGFGPVTTNHVEAIAALALLLVIVAISQQRRPAGK